MKCNTVRMDKDCMFMAKKGCSYRRGKCMPIVEKCGACKNIETFSGEVYCTVYMDPEAIWTTACGRSTVKAKVIVEDTKKVNPLKQSKKDSGGKIKKKK